MAKDEAVRSLRISQTIFTLLNVGLACYLFQHSTRTAQRDVSVPVAISLVAACTSAAGVACTPTTSKLARNPSKVFVAFAIDWLVAFLNLVAFLSGTMFVTRSQYCYRVTCVVMKISTVFTAFNFANWAATATVWGIRIPKSTTNVGTVLPQVEKASA